VAADVAAGVELTDVATLGVALEEQDVTAITARIENKDRRGPAARKRRVLVGKVFLSDEQEVFAILNHDHPVRYLPKLRESRD
jgi:hypothetical protein